MKYFLLQAIFKDPTIIVHKLEIHEYSDVFIVQ